MRYKDQKVDELFPGMKHSVPLESLYEQDLDRNGDPSELYTQPSHLRKDRLIPPTDRIESSASREESSSSNSDTYDVPPVRSRQFKDDNTEQAMDNNDDDNDDIYNYPTKTYDTTEGSYDDTYDIPPPSAHRYSQQAKYVNSVHSEDNELIPGDDSVNSYDQTPAKITRDDDDNNTAGGEGEEDSSEEGESCEQYDPEMNRISVSTHTRSFRSSVPR